MRSGWLLGFKMCDGLARHTPDQKAPYPLHDSSATTENSFTIETVSFTINHDSFTTTNLSPVLSIGYKGNRTTMLKIEPRYIKYDTAWK